MSFVKLLYMFICLLCVMYPQIVFPHQYKSPASNKPHIDVQELSLTEINILQSPDVMISCNQSILMIN